MILLIKLLLLVGLIKLLIAIDKPFLCSGIYACVVFLAGLSFGGSFVPVLVFSVIAFGLSSLYF